MQYQGCQADAEFTQTMQAGALLPGWLLLLLMAGLARTRGWPTLFGFHLSLLPRRLAAERPNLHTHTST